MWYNIGMNKTELLNKTELRQIAIGAARSYLREKGVDPTTASAQSALTALDDVARDSSLVVSGWYKAASGNQIKLFSQEWRRWQREKKMKFIRNYMHTESKIHASEDGKKPLCMKKRPKWPLHWEVMPDWQPPHQSLTFLHREMERGRNQFYCKKCARILRKRDGK